MVYEVVCIFKELFRNMHVFIEVRISIFRAHYIIWRKHLFERTHKKRKVIQFLIIFLIRKYVKNIDRNGHYSLHLLRGQQRLSGALRGRQRRAPYGRRYLQDLVWRRSWARCGVLRGHWREPAPSPAIWPDAGGNTDRKVWDFRH